MSKSKNDPLQHVLVPLVQPADPSSTVSLVQSKMATFEPSQRQSGAGVVPWSPPQVNWNPWTSSNIDEGPLAYVSLRRGLTS